MTTRATPDRQASPMRRRLAAAFGFSLVAGALMVGTTGTAAAAPAPGDCTVPSEATVFYGPNVNGDYVVPAGTHAVSVLAIGGGGATDTGNSSSGGRGAQVTTVLEVTPGDSLAITVGSTATGPAGGTSAGTVSGGAGSEYSLNFGDGPVNYHSGGGGGASFVTLDSTTLVAAGAGGGGGYGGSLSGGDAGPATTESHPSATVFTGADGVTVDPTADPAVGGKGGHGGSSVPGIGGAVADGYGAGSGLPGVGEIGGAAFVNGGFNVGAGGGGGGYQGGGGGGGGGYAGGGGAGSSYSAGDYDIVAATEEAQVLITALAPAFDSAESATFQAGVLSSFVICAPAVPTATITGAGTLPEGITLVDNGDGTATLSGTPTGNSLGEYPLALNAVNANGSADQAFTLTVAAGPAVALSLTGPTSADPGEAFDLGITAVDEFGNTATDFNGTVELTYTDDGVPVEKTLVLTNGVGTLAVTLTHPGDHIIVVNSRTEGVDADSLTVTVTDLSVTTTADTETSPTTGSTTAPPTGTTEDTGSGSATETTTTAAAGAGGSTTTTLPSTASTWATAPDLANTGAAVGPAIGVALGLLLAGAGALAYAGRRRDFTH